MPYIDQASRDSLAGGVTPINPGELNYLITEICSRYLRTKGERYQTYNDIMGALEGAKLELYRRQIAPYEDVKIIENGDVY